MRDSKQSEELMIIHPMEKIAREIGRVARHTFFVYSESNTLRKASPKSSCRNRPVQ